MDKITEVEGELIEYTWGNPHVRLKVRVINANGVERIWKAQGNSLSHLRRTNAETLNLKRGDSIKIAGWPTRRPSNELYLQHLLTLAFKNSGGISKILSRFGVWKPKGKNALFLILSVNDLLSV